MNENKALEFIVRDVSMCMYLSDLYKVLPLVELKKIPSSPQYVAGLMNLKGESIPVLDLALCIGLDRHEMYSIDMPILLCEVNKKKMGFIIDKIKGLFDFNESHLQQKKEFNENDSFYLGTLIINQEPILLIDTAKLIGKVAI